MNLDYTDEQKAIKEQIAKLLQERCTSKEVRRVLVGEEPDFHRELWRELAQLGWLSATIAVEYEQIGGAQRTLEQAVSYAQQRYAFGRPIGAFQAIKHKLVDMYIQVELAKSNAYYAAWALATQSDQLPVAAATARVSATTAFELAARESLHVHGGFGMTWESDCHLFYRRSRRLAVALGSKRDWQDRLISLLEQHAA